PLSPIPGVTFNSTVVTDTLITTNMVIDPTAALGQQNIIVTTPSGPSNALPFTITAAVPVLTTINPTQGTAGTTVSLTLTGTDLFGGTLNLPAGFTVSGTPVVTPTSLSASLVIASTVAAGPLSITVTTPGGTSNAMTITILPALTGITPSSARAGATTSVTIAGTSL